MKNKAKNLSLTIGWLYSDLMNTYGDRGNIIVLTRRGQWRKIKVKVEQIFLNTKSEILNTCDLLFMGGAQDTQQEIVNLDLQGKKGKVLIDKIENGTPGLYICGAYQFLGKYYKTADGKKLPGLGIFPLYTENPGGTARRLIGNTIVKPKENLFKKELIGFENHGGRTYLEDKFYSLGTVKNGYGNNSEDSTEGILYKNSIGTYLHGPLLPKNPEIADWLISKALENKYGKIFSLTSLDDSIEEKARDQVIKTRF